MDPFPKTDLTRRGVSTPPKGVLSFIIAGVSPVALLPPLGPLLLRKNWNNAAWEEEEKAMTSALTHRVGPRVGILRLHH